MLSAVTSSEVWDEEAAKRYESENPHLYAPEVLNPTLEFLARLAGPGPALEFAIGTGRVGVPLAARGIPVTGIELSPPMVAQLRHSADEATLPVVVGDMATTVVSGDFSLVYLVRNTISNLLTQEEQVECFRNAARHLRSGGHFLIELWVPPLRRLPPGQLAALFDVSERHLGFDTYDLGTQRCTSHHYRHDEGGPVRHHFRNFRYLWPAECDLMARIAGMELEQRIADWNGAPFTSDSTDHISVWRKP